jgi:hypothetical protein
LTIAAIAKVIDTIRALAAKYSAMGIVPHHMSPAKVPDISVAPRCHY